MLSPAELASHLRALVDTVADELEVRPEVENLPLVELAASVAATDAVKALERARGLLTEPFTAFMFEHPELDGWRTWEGMVERLDA